MRLFSPPCAVSHSLLLGKMKVYINNDLTELEGVHGISELLEFLQIKSTTSLAIAVNDQVIPRADWPGAELNENDRVIIIRATSGG